MNLKNLIYLMRNTYFQLGETSLELSKQIDDDYRFDQELIHKKRQT